MHLLILGGTIFLGRHLVEAAQARGHSVTLFNRGRHHADLFPETEKLRGDRTQEADLDAALAGRRFDVVIDTCGYLPRDVQLSAKRLAGQADHYCFISSVSVYKNRETENQDENAPLGTLEDPAVTEVTGDTYGPLKGLCEQAAEAAFPDRCLTIRPGLIVGPHDPSDRFTYWPHRMAQGGAVLAPGDGTQPVQIIDGRDLAEWTVRMLEGGEAGIYNAAGPAAPLTLQETLEACQSAIPSNAALVWVNESLLREQQVGPWIELPLWVPGPEGRGLNTVSIARACAKGLTFRPLEEIVRDTLAWDATRPPESGYKRTLTPEKERTILEAWSASGRA